MSYQLLQNYLGYKNKDAEVIEDEFGRPTFVLDPDTDKELRPSRFDRPAWKLRGYENKEKKRIKYKEVPANILLFEIAHDFYGMLYDVMKEDVHKERIMEFFLDEDIEGNPLDEDLIENFQQETYQELSFFEEFFQGAPEEFPDFSFPIPSEKEAWRTLFYRWDEIRSKPVRRHLLSMFLFLLYVIE
jgi:hypothetical protein